MAGSFLLLMFCIVLCGGHKAQAGLRVGYYAKTCPQLDSIVQSGLRSVMARDSRAPASLLRLHFHDCFVRGCDASVLLDVSGSEKEANANKNSLRGFNYIDEIKANVEKHCPGVVSCADLLAVVARDSVVLSGGPSWDVPLGRRDGSISRMGEADQFLPRPTFNFSTLVENFRNVTLDEDDMITLSGAHTIGFSQCRFYNDRLYNFSNTGKPDPSLDHQYLASLQKLCGPAPANTTTLTSMDFTTASILDNHYYQHLLTAKGLLNSDQVLYTSGGHSKQLVEAFSKNQFQFFAQLKKSMIKMGNISPILAPKGEIRKNCRFAN